MLSFLFALKEDPSSRFPTLQAVPCPLPSSLTYHVFYGGFWANRTLINVLGDHKERAVSTASASADQVDFRHIPPQFIKSSSNCGDSGKKKFLYSRRLIRDIRIWDRGWV